MGTYDEPKVQISLVVTVHQLRFNCAADRCLCFRYIDSIIWVGLDSKKRIFSEKMRKERKKWEKRLIGTGKVHMR